MSKLYRSMLWSGLVVAGVAACGDDVSVVNPPPPVLTVHSISVAPNGVTVGIGANVITMSAAVNADAGVTNLAVTWSTSDGTKATVSQTGQVTTLAAGSVAIIACSQLVPSVCGNATLTISTTAPSATSVTVTPPAATVVKGNTVQLVASVQGANNPAQTVTWQTSPTPGIATVSATGLVTAVGAGTVPITACSTIAGFTNICGSASITVVTLAAATASISSITWVPPTGPTVCTQGPGPVVPVVLGSVRCQIEVTSNVNGGDQALSRLDVVFTNTALGTSIVVASQTFPGTAPVDGGPQAVAAPVDITLSINTQMLRRPGAAGTPFIPAIFNGNNTISLNLYTVGNPSPLVFNPTPIVMNNTDAILPPGTLVATTPTPSFTDGGGTTWFKGTETLTGAQYISFSTRVPTSVTFGSSVCGTSTAAGSVSGTAATGIPITSIFTCAGVEGLNSVTAAFTIVQASLVGPDGTAVTLPTAYSSIGSAFTLPANNAAGTPADSRWNLITPAAPAPVLPGPVAIDNKAPTPAVQSGAVGVGPAVAFQDTFDQQWINAAYAFSQDISATEFGSGLATLVARDYSAGVFVPASAGCTAVVKTTGADYAETLVSDGTPDGWRICAFATDNLGNSASSGPSNWFGVDKVAPSSRLAGTTAATPLIAPFTPASVSATPNTTIYGDGAGALTGTFPVLPPTDAWGLEALDTRSGFNQNVVAGFPANQTLTRLAVSGPTSCPFFTNAMNTVLSDTWVRTNVLISPTDCAQGIGYYAYNGTVTDRAGNVATPIVRNFAQDHVAAPSLASIGASVPLYTAGTAAPFFVFGSDDLEIIEGDITMSYPNLGLVTATVQGLTYGLSQINGTNPGVRWDNLLNNIVTAGTITVPTLLGRVDFTCTGVAATPYAGCAAVAGSITTVGANFNNVNTTNDGQSPDSVRAIAYDVASNASNSVASGLLSIQTSDVAQAWTGADLITWSVISVAGPIVARHMASTSITAPYFDSVLLGRQNVGATEIRVCGTFPAPALTDNGVNRFWTYSIPTPTGSAQCATGGSWYAIGIKGAAALVTAPNP